MLSFYTIILFGEKKFLYSVEVFPERIKPIKPIQKYPRIIESYACILKIFVVMFLLLLINALISLGISYNQKNRKNNIIIIIIIIILHIQSNPVSSNIRILIKIYYICPILYFIGTVFS